MTCPRHRAHTACSCLLPPWKPGVASAVTWERSELWPLRPSGAGCAALDPMPTPLLSCHRSRGAPSPPCQPVTRDQALAFQVTSLVATKPSPVGRLPRAAVASRDVTSSVGEAELWSSSHVGVDFAFLTDLCSPRNQTSMEAHGGPRRPEHPVLGRSSPTSAQPPQDTLGPGRLCSGGVASGLWGSGPALPSVPA